MPDCFIIMPITTPEALVPAYHNDKDHFQHVLDCLFIPAVKKAGLNPIPPIAKDAEVIQAVIIENLEKADLVLCDMSSLNANVFFELGIRTAIGKPACMVKDDLTQKVPFDMGVVNYHEYASGLNSWAVPGQIDKLASHIKSTAENSKGQNMLWKYFSMAERARLTAPKDDTENRLELISIKMEGLSRKVDAIASKPPINLPFVAPPFGQPNTNPGADVFEYYRSLGEQERNFVSTLTGVLAKWTNEYSLERGPDGYTRVILDADSKPEVLFEIKKIASQYGRKIYINDDKQPIS